jgi:class 3 adenylate cyclase
MWSSDHNEIEDDATGGKIVSNIFLSASRKRLYGEGSNSKERTSDLVGPLLGNDVESVPLTDVYPSVTVYFADIAAFTAWSSAREPPHVFKLLETLYGKLKRLYWCGTDYIIFLNYCTSLDRFV